MRPDDGIYLSQPQGRIPSNRRIIDTNRERGRCFPEQVWQIILFVVCLFSLRVWVAHLSPIGMVWKANDRVQKLPITNKAAYRRAVLEVYGEYKFMNVEFDPQSNFSLCP